VVLRDFYWGECGALDGAVQLPGATLQPQAGGGGHGVEGSLLA
jgi:hypothetical protein